ncbi:MAG: peptidase M15 [Magnetococcales bacterium]|nr:peptidase M15 [Magnetococcales bacterium]
MTLSEHFTLAEFLYSEIAAELHIDNFPSGEHIRNMAFVAGKLEIVRAHLGGHPITITSGYRCPELNKAAGGSSSSAHMQGLAVDFVCPEFGTPKEIVKAIIGIARALGFDQCIFEGPWVHLGWSAGKNRWQVLTKIAGQGGRPAYVPFVG